jgi:hypothetical protein
MATTAMRRMKPPAAPPAMGAMLLDDLEVGEAVTKLDTSTIVGEGVEVVVIVYTLTTPLPSVDVCTSVTTVGTGVVVTTIVVGVGEGCGDVDWE